MSEVILCDLDGCLVEQIGQDWFDWLKRNAKLKKEYHHLLTENYKSVKLPYNLTELFELNIFFTGFEFWNDEFLYEDYVPLKETQKCLDMLHIKGYTIIICSKVMGNHGLSKECFIRKYFPYAKIIFTEDKHFVKAGWVLDDTWKVINSFDKDVKVIKYRNDFEQKEKSERIDALVAYGFNDVYNLITGE